MKIAHFGASTPKRAGIHRRETGTVEDDVGEATEGLRTKYYAVPRSIYNYTLESTMQYSQVFLHTTKHFSVLYKVLDY